MSKTIILFVSGIALVAATIGWIAQNKTPEYAQPIVVLAFVDGKNQVSTRRYQVLHNAGFAVETVGVCTSNDHDKAVACILKTIQQVAKVVHSANSQLVVMGDKTYSKNILTAFGRDKLADEVDGLVLLQADFDLSNISSIKLPKSIFINAPQDAEQDFIARRRAVQNLLMNDNWVWSTTLSTDHIDGLAEHPVLPEMISYLLDKQENVRYLAEFDAESQWQEPLFDNDDFFKHKHAVQEFAVDGDLRRILTAFFHHEPYQLKQWPLLTYRGFDLLTYRASLPEQDQGRYVTFTNRKGHRFFLDLDRYGRYQPEFVIGIDDDNNLYRMSTFYRTKQFTSWEPDGPQQDKLYVQSLGAFIHFRNPLPRQYELPYLQYSTIKFDSIAFSNIDPYAGIKNLTHQAFRVLTQNCIPCHSLDGVGGAAYHMDSQTGEPQPGFARPLRTYSKEIYKNFFYNQTATAALIGVNPNYVAPEVADELLPWLTENE